LIDRRCVLLLFYDFPMITRKQKKRYRDFRKYLIKAGYYALQESVYVRLLSSSDGFTGECKRLYNETPTGSNVKALHISLDKFEQIVTIRGSNFNFSLFRDNILVF